MPGWTNYVKRNQYLTYDVTDMVRAGLSIAALMHLMGHAQVQTTLRYVSLAPADVWHEFERVVQRPLPPPADR